jgi:hypothetical protein
MGFPLLWLELLRLVRVGGRAEEGGTRGVGNDPGKWRRRRRGREVEVEQWKFVMGLCAARRPAFDFFQLSSGFWFRHVTGREECHVTT